MKHILACVQPKIFTKGFLEKCEWLQKFSEYFKVDHMKRQKPNPTFCSIEWHEIVISGILTFTNELSFFGGTAAYLTLGSRSFFVCEKSPKILLWAYQQKCLGQLFFLLLFWVESEMKKKLGRASWMSIK